jgi:NAD-dependent DNA ligase
MFTEVIVASSKPTSILLSKSDIPIEVIEGLDDSEAWSIIYSIREKKARDDRLQVCFTGFNASKKIELCELAENKNMRVMSGVTKKLDFLCGGENSGPIKIKKAEDQGVQFLNENQFKELIETGEIPKET